MTLFKILNSINYFDNDFVFYGLFTGCVGALGYSLISSYRNKKSVDKGTQTDTSENLMDNPATSEVGIQTIAEDVNTVTTVLPTQPVNTEVVSNPEIIEIIIDTTNAEKIAKTVEKLNILDPFIAIP
jgi:copper chaperone CopZ